MTGFGAAIVGALWSYNGWAVVAVVAEEVRAPERTLPRALIGASVLIIGLYLRSTSPCPASPSQWPATPGRALAGLGIIALGLPVYAFCARRLPPARPEDWLGA
jgi:APA family basic amino acid/polyamine antiporter